ncbi:hypothetical protein ACFC26_43680 [Kitasatospora purpeofusca]|uniref:hypothetical protein n=1 Tax=Kitasatospora purpeofusca TaxID=67352 RepID=UPI0035DC0DBB
MEIDARGIKVGAGIDARGIGSESRPTGCAECGGELRSTGPGRRPVFCGRSCSSKAYRRRRAERQQDAVADALVSSRVEIPDAADAGDRELLDLAAAVRRATARYLENLELARRGEGDDPRCNQALALLETALDGATRRIVRKAHVLRYDMTVERRRAEREAARELAAEPAEAPLVSSRVETAAAASAPAAPGAVASADTGGMPAPGATPVPSRPASPAGSAAPPISARVETSGPAALLNSPRVETAGPSAPLNTPRVETTTAAPTTTAPAPDPTPVPAPPTVTVPKQLRLALAAAPTAHSPLARGLGAPTNSWRVENSDLVVEEWSTAAGLFAVRDATRRLLGWVEPLADGWGAWIKGRLITDATDGQPWLSSDAPHAVGLLRAARDQRLT